MSLTLELSRTWESHIAQHCDRHWFAGVDPFENDLPQDLIEALQKVGAGETAGSGNLSATVCESTADEAAGYLPILFALKNNTAKQADFTPLASLSEPYVRSHEDDADFYATPRRACSIISIPPPKPSGANSPAASYNQAPICST
ncbi:hypothetical protein MASR1M60_06970 [Rhodocyclaceae bacterium]